MKTHTLRVLPLSSAREHESNQIEEEENETMETESALTIIISKGVNV